MVNREKRLEMHNINSPRDIYTLVLNEVDRLIQSFENREVDDDIRNTQEEALKSLRGSQQRISDSVGQLEKNSEWDVFTIAFYGETNAGKSTLIETLRILLNEPKKMNERQTFDQKLKEYNMIRSEIKNGEQYIDMEIIKNKEENEAVDDKLQKLSIQLQDITEKTQSLKIETDAVDTELQKYSISLQDNAERLLSIKKDINCIDIKLQKVAALLQDSLERESSLKIDIDNLNSTVHDEKSLSILNTIWYFLGRLPSQKAAKERQAELSNLEKDIHWFTNLQTDLLLSSENLNKEWSIREFYRLEMSKKEKYGLQTELLQSQEKSNKEFSKRQHEKAKKLERLNDKANLYSEQIKNYSDGKIIGDGSSDFTKVLEGYTFNYGNRKFSLLDVPGIEGNERNVLNKINKAMQKAHVVFYVTKHPTPPQTGDKSDGTLQKIKKHLGQQTEVYTIFNKPASNPKMLEKLENMEKTNSLKDLDETMQKALGKQYGGHISLSAYPAFLAVANCWENSHTASKNKFIKYFNSEKQLLCKTGVDKFSKQLTTDIVSECITKIKESNYMKIINVIDSTTEEIGQVHTRFITLQKKITGREKSTIDLLDTSVKKLNSDLNNESHNAVENFRRYVRNKTYNAIDKGFDNDRFEKTLTEYSKEGINVCEKELKFEIERHFREFCNDVSEIIDRHWRDASELLEGYIENVEIDTKFKLSIDIKSDIKWLNLVMSITAIISSILFTQGAVLIVGVIIGVISVLKAARGLIDHNYRKTQQKKSADKNIDKMADEINKDIKEKFSKVYESLDSKINEIKQELKKMISRIDKIIDITAESKSKFSQLSKSINKGRGN